MKKFLLIAFLLIGPFLYLTNAQLRFTDSRQQPVEGLIVNVTSLDGINAAVLITDNNGTVIPDFPLPYIFRTYHFAFLSLQDTIYNGDVTNFVVSSNNINLNEISVTGNYSTTDRSVYQSQVITKQQIEAQSANNLQDLFTHQLNVRLQNDQATGSSISLQGIDGQNVKVLVDGVPVIGRLMGNINLSQLNLNNVERVEVIRGPASVLYGTNALGGVINIITDASSNPPFKTGINTYYESNGQYNVDAYANLHFKKSDVSVSGGRNFFDGWSERETYREDEWNPKEQRFVNFRIGHKFKNTRLVYQSSLFSEKVTNLSGNVVGWPYHAYVYDVYFNTERFNNNLEFSHLFDASHNLKVTAAYSFYKYIRSTYRKNMETLDQILTADPSQQDTTEFGATMLRAVYTKDDLNSKLNYQVGLDLNSEYSTGERIRSNKQDIGDYAAFASLEYRPVAQLLIRPGVRYAYNTTYKAPVVPSVQLMYELKSRTVFRASYSRGFRSPVLKELYLQFIDANHNVWGNTNLKSEESDHIQASIEQGFLKGKTNIKISPSVFFNYIKNRISLVEKDTFFTYMNFYKFNTQGMMITATIDRGSVSLSAGYSYTGIFNSEIEGTDYLYASEITSMIQYKVPKVKTLVALFWKYNGSQPQYVVNSDDPNGELILFHGEGYSMVDATITQKLAKDRITIGAGMKNILDVTTIRQQSTASAHQASGMQVFAGMGRSYFIRFQYQFTK